MFIATCHCSKAVARSGLALLNLSSWCIVMVERLFLAVPGGCLQFVIVVFSDHTHLLFLIRLSSTVPPADKFQSRAADNKA